MRSFKSGLLITIGVLIGVVLGQNHRPVNVMAQLPQSDRSRVVVTLVGNDPGGKPIYLISSQTPPGCWIGVAGEHTVLVPATLSGPCR